MTRKVPFVILTLIGHVTADLAKEGQTCGGFNESTGGPFPDCAAGLECKSTCEVSIPGACNSCVRGEDALEGETCEGLDESTGEPFPDCAEGLECKDRGEVSIPGAGSSCVLVEKADEEPPAGSGATTGLSLAATLYALHLLAF